MKRVFIGGLDSDPRIPEWLRLAGPSEGQLVQPPSSSRGTQSRLRKTTSQVAFKDPRGETLQHLWPTSASAPSPAQLKSVPL